MSDRCKLELGNGRVVRACVWKGDVRVDIREYRTNVPMTIEEISLKCRTCLTHFYTQDSLKRHVNTVHRREYVPGESSDMPLVTESYTDIPTKKGISLSLGRWKILVDSIEDIDEALDHGRAYIRHLGGNVYCKVEERCVCVDIRQYWKPLGQDAVVPTKKGICLRPEEYKKLKDIVPDIGGVIPELDGVVPCYLRSDHQNQEGLLECSECNPNGID
jgi:hypothetical protein